MLMGWQEIAAPSFFMTIENQAAESNPQPDFYCLIKRSFRITFRAGEAEEAGPWLALLPALAPRAWELLPA